jgi:hypothetical protein
MKSLVHEKLMRIAALLAVIGSLASAACERDSAQDVQPMGMSGMYQTGGVLVASGFPASGGMVDPGGVATGGVSFATGSGGSAGIGGSAVIAGSGGIGGSGGIAGSGGSVPQGGTDACAPPATPLDPSTFPPCPNCADKPAHCVPTTLVSTMAPDQVSQLLPCDETSVCVPDTFISTLGTYDPPPCTSINGGIGRCLSVCIGAVASMGSLLPQDVCVEGEVCAPCTDPRNGEVTGACSMPCDTGPQEPAVVFSRCCADQSGICVPPSLVDETQKQALAQGECAEGELCAPEVFADASFVPATCTSVAGAEGRCVSTCVDLISKQAELLPQDICAAGELCAPCTDPRTGELTGACALNGDAPTQAPVIFDQECCGTTGICVPLSAVPEQYSEMLPADTCTSAGADWVCVPKIKLQDMSAKFPTCQVLLAGIPVPAGDPNQFGACIPQCIADNQIEGNILLALGLAQSDCDSGWACAPCVNPLDQTPTGACD